MSKWIDFSIDERKAMIQGVVEAKNIDEAAAEKDWWVTAILYALFHTKICRVPAAPATPKSTSSEKKLKIIFSVNLKMT